ncbi:MAG: YXWGXW repeat-containing protein [Bacteroidota bacterium]|nr:YXWGXW repeat-containing protein [Bacteroidota bacterium]
MKKILFACLLTTTPFIFYSCGPMEITVSDRPSPPVYVRPVSPGPGYIWIEGDWIVRDGHYHWREGHWVRNRNRVWIGGSWESRNNGWYWRRGHWR